MTLFIIYLLIPVFHMQKVLQLSRTIKHFKAGQLKGKFNYEFKKFCFEKMDKRTNEF